MLKKRSKRWLDAADGGEVGAAERLRGRQGFFVGETGPLRVQVPEAAYRGRADTDSRSLQANGVAI